MHDGRYGSFGRPPCIVIHHLSNHDMRLKDSYIYLLGLRFHASHGVAAQERLTGNDFEVDLRLRTDLSKAMTSDDVNDTINYAEAYALTREEMQTPSALIEHVAYRIARRLFLRWPELQAIDIRLTKLNPPMGADSRGAGVELHLINDKTESQ